MKKQKSSLPQVATIPVANTNPFGRLFIVKGDKLLPEPNLPENSEPVLKSFRSKQEFTKLILTNRSVLLGESTIALNAKMGKTTFPWDAFIFDFSEREKPRCYLLAIALGKEPFADFFMSMTRIFSFLRNGENIRMLIDSLVSTIQGTKTTKKAFGKFLDKDKFISDFVTETIFERCRILLMTDEDRAEFPELRSAYAEIWNEMLSVIFLRKYQVGKANMIGMHPSSLAELNEQPKVKTPKVKIDYTESFHFEKTTDVVKAVYEKMKAELLKADKSLLFNVQKFYVSMKKGRNLAFFHLRRKNLYLVVMNPEKDTRKVIKNHEIKSLPDSVKKFWNGDCCAINVYDEKHLSEVINLLKRMIK